ncbi:unnamed protein product [Calypogeia fissa]
MEAEEVGHVSAAGTSSAIAATVTAGTDDSAVTNESTLDMPTEITPAGTDSQPPRSRVQYSTDLRKELSLDVLASLGDLAADDANSVDESVLDMASVPADMDFISELPSLDHTVDDATAPETLLPSSTTALEDPHHDPASAGTVTKWDVSLRRSPSSSKISEPFASFPQDGLSGDDSRLVTPGLAAEKSISSHPCDELSTEVPLTTSLSPVNNLTSSGTDVMVENGDLLSSVSVSPSTEENPLLADASTDLQPSHAREEVTELALAGPPASDSALTASAPSHLPAEPVIPSSGNLGTGEACHDSPKPFPSSPDHPSLVSDVSPIVPATASSPLQSLSLDAIEHLDLALARSVPLPEVTEPASLTSSDSAAEFSPVPAVSSVSEMQSCTPGDTDISEAPITSLEAYPGPLEILPSAPGNLLTTNFPMGIENSPLSSPSLPSGAAASGDDVEVGGLAAFSSPSASVNVFVPNFSPAANSTPVQNDLSPSSNNTEVLDSSMTSSSPLNTSALDTIVPDSTRTPYIPSFVAAKVPTFNDSVASPPLTARFWDVPSISPGISLSVYFDGSRASFRGRKINRKKKLSEPGADTKDTKGKGLGDVDKLEEVAELESMLESQKRMVKWQIDEIQRIATLQFQLTGSSPLSEQAIWEVLGVKGGGKKAGDALSTEALKSLHEMFAIKDTLTKKEARDISFTFGASLTQVRDYFAAQRSFVRKLVQQAHDEAGRLGIKNASEQSQQIAVSNSISEVEKDLGFDKLSGPESVEKTIEAMRAEKGFAGQIQLLQIILRADSAALILRRFLEKGALKMLGGWLVEAVTEQQTSVISHILKVLDHLPMSNAVSNQMPPLVHNVNKLRFYHASAVAGQARSLLTKWVKLLSQKTEVKSASSPGSKALAGSANLSAGLKRARDPPAAQLVPGTRKKKIKAEEVLQQESKASQIAGPDSPSLTGTPQGASEHLSSNQISVSPLPPPKQKWSSTLQPSESAVAAVSVSRKRLGSKSLGEQSKDRRKLMRVEDNHIGKSIGSKPATISKTSRPLSTDDIYKAKKLERLMQEPILKSKRKAAAAQEQSRAEDMVPQTSVLKKSLPPAVPADIGSAKREIPNSIQGSWRGGALTTKPSQEDQPTATRTQLPIRSPVDHGVGTTITPNSSQDLFQTVTPTVTPTSSQEQGHPGSVMAGLTDDTACKRDSNLTAPMESHPLPSSVVGTSGQEMPVISHFGRSLQLPAAVNGSPGVNSAVSNAAETDLGNAFQSSQSFVSESYNMTVPMVESDPAVFDDLPVSPTPIQPSVARLEEASGLSVTNSYEKSAIDVTRSKFEVARGWEHERGANDVRPLPRETSLSDYYALLRATMIRWRIPPVYQPDEQWNVAAGEDSKEREVQSGRVKREEEAYYPELSAVPDDPKDPWEEEPDYDDSLTLQIFVENEQRKAFTEGNDLSNTSKAPVMNVVQYGPETSFGSDVLSGTMPSSNHGQEPPAELLSKAPAMNGLDLVLQQLSSGGGGGTHDPDLLALLLRNPQLVSQLTSGPGFNPTSITNPGVFMQLLDPLKQLSSGGNNGANTPPGDLGQERLIPSNNSKALGIPLQPGRSVSSVDRTPPETMRVQDSIPMMPHPGMGQQQTMGFVPPGGVDNRFMTPQMPALIARNIQDTPGWEHLRVPPPPPPVPPTQPVINQVLQPPLPNQPNKQSNWHESQVWVGVGRPPLNQSQTRSGPDQLHTRQTLMTHNVRPPNYPGMVGLPQVEVVPETSVVNQPEVHHSQRPWLNGSHCGPTHENAMMHAGQDSGASRNNRWPRPPVRPTNQQVRSGNREFSDFNNGRQTTVAESFNNRQATVVDNRSAWVQNERARAVVPPFQSAYNLPPPPPYPAPLWQGQEGNMRVVQGHAGNAFPHGRDLRPPQQQMWHNNMGPTSR